MSNFKNLKVKTSHELLEKSLSTTIKLDGILPSNIDPNSVFAVSPLWTDQENRFMRTLFLKDGNTVPIVMELSEVDPALIELENEEELKNYINKFKEIQEKNKHE